MPLRIEVAGETNVGMKRNHNEDNFSIIEESGLYNKGWVEPIEMPFASRMLAIEGSYSHRLENANLRAGMRYRERSGEYARRFTGDASGEYVAEYLDAYGNGDWQLNQTVLLEYGLFTTMRDGSARSRESNASPRRRASASSRQAARSADRSSCT